MKTTFRILINALSIYFALAILFFGYKIIFDTEVVLFKVTKVSKVEGINKFLLGRGNNYCYQMEYEMLKSPENSIHGIYIKYYSEPKSLPKVGDVICGTVAYIRPSSMTDFFKIFYGKDDRALWSYSTVTHKSKAYIASLYAEKSKSFFTTNIKPIGLLFLLVLIGFQINKYLKPTIKKKNGELTFNKAAWLEFTNVLMGFSLLILSCHLVYKSFINNSSTIYLMLLFVIIIAVIAFIYLEFKNRKDYLIIRAKSIAFKDNEIVQEIQVDAIQSYYFDGTLIYLRMQEGVVKINLKDLNLKAYSSVIQAEMRKLLVDKREESGEE
jgi:hypothetical protein